MKKSALKISVLLFLLMTANSTWAETSAVGETRQDCYGNGDVNSDGTVPSLSDVFFFEYFLYKCGPPPLDSTSADLNNDCVGDIDDYTLLQCFYANGTSCFDSYPVPTCCRVRLFRVVNPGDVNRNGSINIIDVTSLISFTYRDGPRPEPLWVADVNISGTVNILDVTYLVSFLYKEGPAPKCIPH